MNTRQMIEAEISDLQGGLRLLDMQRAANLGAIERLSKILTALDETGHPLPLQEEPAAMPD